METLYYNKFCIFGSTFSKGGKGGNYRPVQTFTMFLGSFFLIVKSYLYLS